MKVNIRILDENINLLGEIDDYESLVFTRRFFSVGEFEIRININKNNTDLLQKWNLILLSNQRNKVGIIMHREVGMNELGESSDELYIKGLTLDGLATFRKIVPNVGYGYVNMQGTQEAIMKGFVDNCMVNPQDADRKVPQVAIVQNLNRGIQDKWRGRFDKLSDKLEEIGMYSKLGWNFTLDYVNKKFLFDVKKGRNLISSQSTNPPVIFSVEFDNVLARNYIESILQAKNVLYAGGQGDGELRLIQKVGTIKGFRRIEEFQDFSNAEDAIELKTLAGQRLNELKETQNFEARILPYNSFRLGEDYDLGDYVTIVDKKLGLRLDTQIIEIKETHNEQGFNIDIVFGDKVFNVLGLLRRKDVVR